MATHIPAAPARSAEQELKQSRAVVFDLYNTLVVDGELPPEVWEHLVELGYRCGPALQSIFEPDAYDGCLTPRNGDHAAHDAWMENSWRRLLELSGVEAARVDEVLRTVLTRQRAFTVRPAPHAREFFLRLRDAGYRIGLCSNWESDVDPFLSVLGLSRKDFDAVAVSAEIGARKPHSAIFEAVCDGLETVPADAVHIGDNWRCDVVGALRAGLRPIWLNWEAKENSLPHLVAEASDLAMLSTAFASERENAK